MFPLRTSVEVDEISSVVIGLIVANVAVFLVQIELPESLREAFLYRYALVPARYTQPDFASGLGLDPDNFLPLLTNTFMHAGLVHLLVNLWTLWLFGGALEQRLGTVRFIAFYLLCGAIASLAHLAFNLESRIPALGASGAIAGVLGGYTLLHPRAKISLVTPVLFFPITYRLPAAVYTAIWLVFQVVGGVAELAEPQDAGGIAWWAHIGGFLSGLVLILLMGKLRRQARYIGVPRERQREIGGPRARVVRVGSKRSRVQRIGAKGRGREKLRTLTQPRRSVAPARARSSRARSVDTPWSSAATSPEPMVEAHAPSRDRGRWTRRAQPHQRSIIPSSGGSDRAHEPTAEMAKSDADSLALIDELLVKPGISEDLRKDLENYKADIAAGEFREADRRYVRAVHQRLSKHR